MTSKISQSDATAQKLHMWREVGLDFCTNCCAENLEAVTSLYGDSSYIRCATCGENQF